MPAFDLFLALLLAGSSAHKALDRRRLGTAAARLTGMPAQSAPLLLIVAGTVEAVAALSILIAPLRMIGLVAAATVWTVYGLAMLRRHGETLDCGCDLVAREKPVGPAQIARPMVLALLAVLSAIVPAQAMGGDAPFAAAGLLAIYVAAAEILAIPRPAWRKS